MQQGFRNNNIKNITLISILVALGVIFSYVDKVISMAAFPFLPTAKIGIANIVLLVGIYRFSFRESLAMAILKSVLVGLVFASVSAFVIGGSATMASYVAMFFMHRLLKEKISLVGVSVVGGFVHIVVQLLVVSIYYQLGEVVMYYGLFLVFISLITSILVGLVGNKLYMYLGSQIQSE